MKTRITEMLGIEYPILCGGMMRLAYPPLCAAISDAGGLGNLTAGNFASKDEFVEAIRKTREMTDKPFWVNITLLPAIGITDDRYRDYFEVVAAEQVADAQVEARLRGLLPALVADGQGFVQQAGGVAVAGGRVVGHGLAEQDRGVRLGGARVDLDIGSGFEHGDPTQVGVVGHDHQHEDGGGSHRDGRQDAR